MAKKAAKSWKLRKASKKAIPGWSRLLSPSPKPVGPTLAMEFVGPRDGIRLFDFGGVFASLEMVGEELVRLPQDIASPRPGLYVSQVTLNSPLRVEITFVKIPDKVAEAFRLIFDSVLFYRQAARLKHAEAALVEQRARAAMLDNARKAVMLARDLNGDDPEVRESAAELMNATESLLESPLRIEQVRLLPPQKPQSRRRRRST